MRVGCPGSPTLRPAGQLGRLGREPGAARQEQDQPCSCHSNPLPMASSSGVWEPLNGSAPRGPAGPGGELVTVKVAAHPGGLVVNW